MRQVYQTQYNKITLVSCKEAATSVSTRKKPINLKFHKK